MALLCTLLFLPCRPALRPPPPLPSFLIIMADDLGIGDLGCYGNHTLRWGQREGVGLAQISLS